MIIQVDMVFSEFELEELNRISQDFQEVSAYMREIFISLVLFTNKWEGLSKAAIEAYSFGLPLLLSNVHDTLINIYRYVFI